MILERNLYKEIEPYLHLPDAIVITGMRRTGKTSLLQYIYNKIDSENKIFLDLENPISQKKFEELDYDKIKFNLGSLGLDFTKKAYIFLDEIQFVKKLPSAVKYLYDHNNIKFFLTGSASFYLKNLFTESLAGRKFFFELYPLTFGEFLVFKGLKLKLPEDKSRPASQMTFETFNTLYQEYLEFGGFPGVVFENSPQEKRKRLEEIFTSYFQLEILQLSDFRRPQIIRDLILLLAQRSGSRLDIVKLARELGINRRTLDNYIYFLENTYLIKLVRPFSKNRDAEIRRTPKFYLCDSGLLNYLGKISEGAIFENNVFQNLRIKGEVNYYQRKDDREIDFIINKKIAYEAKITPDIRDYNKLEKLAGGLNIKDYKIISRNFTELAGCVYGFTI